MPRLPRLGVIVLGALLAVVLAPPFVVDAAHREETGGCATSASVATERSERAAEGGLVVVEERTTRREVDCEGRASRTLLAARESYRAEAGLHALELTWRANGTKQLVVLDARGLAGSVLAGPFETYPVADLSARTHRPLLPL